MLTFGTPRMLRHLTSPAARKEPIQEIHLATVLDEMKLTMEQFIEMCILCGCDYVSGTSNTREIAPRWTSCARLIVALSSRAAL